MADRKRKDTESADAPPAKAANVSDSTTQPTEAENVEKGAVASAGPESAAETAAKLKVLLEKLVPVLASDAKAPKGMPILLKAVEASLTADTAELFFPCFTAALQSEKRIHTAPMRATFLELGQLFDSKMDCFSKSRQYDVETWVLACVSHNLMFTDDTYRFVRGARRLAQALAALDPYFGPKFQDVFVAVVEVSPGQLTARKAVIVAACETMVHECYKYAWARPSVDSMFKVGIAVGYLVFVVPSVSVGVVNRVYEAMLFTLQDIAERLAYFQDDHHVAMIELIRAHQARRAAGGKDEKALGNGHRSWAT